MNGEIVMKHRSAKSITCTKFNVYACGTCGVVVTTVDIDEGTTPASLTCPRCRSFMESAFYLAGPFTKGIPDPTIEWYKPATVDITDLNTYELQHVAFGGLLHQPIPQHHRTKIMIAFQKWRLHSV